MGFIYRLVFPNGKSYVGQTKRKKVSTRWRMHKNRKDSNCRALQAAIRKYGWSNVRKEVLLEVSEEKLDKWEVHYIAKIDSYHNGYNLTPGGDFNPMRLKAVRDKLSATCSTPEHKAVTSQRIKALHADPKWKARWHAKQKASHQTGEHRAGQSKRSQAQWAKEKAAGKDRGAAIRAELNNPEYKARRAARRANDPREKARISKIKAFHAAKKAPTGSQYAACQARAESPSLDWRRGMAPVRRE